MDTYDRSGHTITIRFVGLGCLAGAVSTLVFTITHQLFISSIWFALPAMLVAGMLCGLCLAWSYAALVPAPATRSWLLYNVSYFVMFVVLGITSVLVFDPVTTIAALLTTNEPPRELIGQALPLTGLFALGATALLAVLWRSDWRATLGIFATTLVLLLSLGLNISILGLVTVPRAAVGVIFEVFWLLLVILGVYAVLVRALGRSHFSGVTASRNGKRVEPQPSAV